MAERRALMLSVLLYMSGSSASCGIQKTSLVDESEENLAGSAEFPWVVSVQDSQYTHLAFGCILSPFWILSIASAFQDRKEALVLVGIANMDPNRNAYIEYPVSTIILHEDFDNHSMSNNIALLRTDSAMDFDDLVRSICFLGKSQHKLPALRNCWVSGWNPTSATGNHMTMSILRRISVKDLDLCLLDKHQPLGCGSHTERETDAVCLAPSAGLSVMGMSCISMLAQRKPGYLPRATCVAKCVSLYLLDGEPGSPMMCQLQQLDLWVLQGLLTQGGETCPGLFLYTKVEDYSDWITAQARRAGLPLSALHHWEKLFHFPHHESRAAVTGAVHAKMGHTGWSQPYLQRQTRSTVHLPQANISSARHGLDFRVTGLQEPERSPRVAAQPMYYDYYGGENVKGVYFAGQDRLHKPQEITLVFFVLVFFGCGV